MEKTKILIVEDDPGIQESLFQILELYNFEIERASSGEQGLIKALSFRPEIILSDITMPGIDGYELLEKLRQLPTFKFVPIILLTAKISEDDVRKGMNSGASDFLKKPFKVVDLINSINTQLSKYKEFKAQNEKISSNLIKKQESLKNLIFINSHELRGPLSTAIGLAELIDSDQNNLYLIELKNSLKKCDHVVHRMNDLISMTLNEGGTFSDKEFFIEVPKTILFIDDDPIQQLIVKKTIQNKFNRTNVIISGSVDDGIEKIKIQNIDLIISDLNMPNKNGFELFEYIHSQQLKIPIVVLSSTISVDDVTRSMSYDDVKLFLTKPFDVSKLRDIIKM